MADEDRGDGALRPVRESERIQAIDTLRGVALLGILVMNIPHVAFHSAWFMNPTIAGPLVGTDRLIWLGTHLVFDMKMMAIFSMLFGAGLVLMDGRAAQRGRAVTGVYYRRLAWLLLFGLAHAYLLWSGDILFIYAICGMLIYPLRRLPAKWLAVLGACIMVVAIPIGVGQGFFFAYAKSVWEAAQPILAAGGTPSEMQQGMIEAWEGVRLMTEPDSEHLAEERAAFTGPYADWVVHNAKNSLMMQTFLLVTWGLWRVTGLMLIGMALFKWGVVSAARSSRFYAGMVGVGYAVGLPIVYWGAMRSEAAGFDVIRLFQVNWHFNYVGSVLVALGHIGVVMLVCRSGALPGLRARLAAVGRMALSNYLAHTVIFTTLFLGWGFALWGKTSRAELLLIVLGVWLLQLAWSPAWLARFRFGPAEWLWRSLTYWKPQPFRRSGNETGQA